MTKNICPRCGNDRWKTNEKERSWQCRNCGYFKGKGGGVIRIEPKKEMSIEAPEFKIEIPEEKPKLAIDFPSGTITNIPKKLNLWQRTKKRILKFIQRG